MAGKPTGAVVGTSSKRDEHDIARIDAPSSSVIVLRAAPDEGHMAVAEQLHAETGLLVFVLAPDAQLSVLTADELAAAGLARVARDDIVLRTVERGGVTDALVAIERAREQGMYDDEQLRRVGPIVLGLRAARDQL